MLKVTPILALVLGATPLLAQDFSADDRAVFIATLAANGCTMTEAGAAVAFPAAGVDKDLSWQIADDLVNRGQATLSADGQTFTLSQEICP